METIYQSRIRKRGYIHFLIGLFVRIPSFLKFSYSRLVARAKGAIVDRSVTIPVAVAKKFNHGVIVDSNVSIGYHVDFTSMLYPMHIGHHVIRDCREMLKIVFDFPNELIDKVIEIS